VARFGRGRLGFRSADSGGHDFAELPERVGWVYEVARKIDADIYVNIQGDEPTLTADSFRRCWRSSIGPRSRFHAGFSLSAGEFTNPTPSKCDALDGRALYFSRATIPFDRTRRALPATASIWNYAYRKAALERFAVLHFAAGEAERWSNCGCSRTGLLSMWPMRRGTHWRGYGRGSDAGEAMIKGLRNEATRRLSRIELRARIG